MKYNMVYLIMGFVVGVIVGFILGDISAKHDKRAEKKMEVKELFIHLMSNSRYSSEEALKIAQETISKIERFKI